VTIADIDNASNAASDSSTATIVDAQLASVCAGPTGTISATFAGATATFSDTSSTGTLSDFSAIIAWGDGTTSAGTISGGPGTAPYTVNGTHTYTTFGLHAINTTITDAGGSTTIASCAPVFVVPASTAPTCDIESAGAIRALNGDPAAFFGDITPPTDVDRTEDGRASMSFENAVVYSDFGAKDRFLFRSSTILAVTCTDGKSATIYGVGTVSNSTGSGQVFFILDLTPFSPGHPASVRLQLFGAHPYDSGIQRVFGVVLINSEQADD
jgi:hypothetical protein